MAAQEAAGEAVEKLQPQLRKLADEGAEARAAAEAERMQKEEAEQLKGEVRGHGVCSGRKQCNFRIGNGFGQFTCHLKLLPVLLMFIWQHGQCGAFIVVFCMLGIWY